MAQMGILGNVYGIFNFRMFVGWLVQGLTVVLKHGRLRMQDLTNTFF